MNIRRFAAQGVHGYLRFNIKFNPDISYLDGINGSGKTTVLKAIVSLLMPDILWLHETEFSDLEVVVEHESKTFSVKATKDKNRILLSVPENDLSHGFGLGELRRFVEFISDDPSLRARQAVIEPLLRPNKVIDFIKSLPTPMFLGLERTAQSDGALPGQDVLLRPPRPASRRTAPSFRASPMDASIEQAAELAGNAYRLVRRDRARLTQELRSHLIMAAFAKPPASSGGDTFPDDRARIAFERTGTSVRQALSQLGIPQETIQKDVVPFFSEISEIMANLPKGQISRALGESHGPKVMNAIVEWISRRFQIGFIYNLTSAIEKYNNNLRMVDQSLDRYTRLVDQFLRDSGKSIEFPQDADVPVVRLRRDKIIPLKDLSSGEKQIVIILTHLSFNPSTRQANVLIIDEPEISLHIHWQEIFVSSLREANPKTQIILATHSPSIILDDKLHSVGL